MKKFLKELSFEATTILIASVAIVAGIILMVLPGTSLRIICFIIGLAIGAKGGLRLAKFVSESQDDTSKISDLIIASLIITLALVLIIHPNPILAIFPTLVGIGIAVYGIVNLVKKGLDSTAMLVVSVSTIVFGVAVAVVPLIFVEIATFFLGASLVAIGIFAIAFEVKLKKKYGKIEKPFSDGYTEVEFKDVYDNENK